MSSLVELGPGFLQFTSLRSGPSQRGGWQSPPEGCLGGRLGRGEGRGRQTAWLPHGHPATYFVETAVGTVHGGREPGLGLGLVNAPR